MAHQSSPSSASILCYLSFIASEAVCYIMGGNGLKKSVYAAALNQLILSNEQTPSANVTNWHAVYQLHLGNQFLPLGVNQLVLQMQFVYFPGMKM